MVTYGDMKTMFINEKNQAARELRKKFTGEVFTPRKLVSQMLNKLPKEVWLKGKTFLDNSCGNGNFLISVLQRKINRGHKPLEALQSIFGCDIMSDSIKECRWRLLKLVSIYEDVTPEHVKSVWKNVVWININKFPGGSLDYDFSFNSTPKQANIDRWMLAIQNGFLNSISHTLDIEEEEFVPNDEKGYNSVFTPEDML